MKRKSTVLSAVLIIFWISVVLITLTPLLSLLCSSFRPGVELMRTGLNFSIDKETFTLDGYKLLFSGNTSYFTWYKNSLILTAIEMVLTLFLSSCVAYGFSMYKFKGANILFICVLITMMVPMEIIILPLYQEIAAMGMLDTIWGIILPKAVVPMLVFFFRQYLSGIPKDFLDAGRVDGCTEYGIFFRIFVPLMAPSFAAMGIFQGMQSWNNFLWPLIVMRSSENQTLPVGLASLLSPYGNNYDLLISGSCFAIIPILILFFCFQSYFIDGMTAGAVKG